MNLSTLRARLGVDAPMPPPLADVTDAPGVAFGSAPGVVVIGASAGGMEALGTLLPALPPDFALAVLLVVHLRSDIPSLLAQTLAVRCRLPVLEPDDKQPIDAGHVYVAPSGYHMLVEPTCTLSLSTEAPVRFSRPSIDVLFESAAWVYGERVLGVLLSGANDDGARGLEAVRAAGGVGWAQRPGTAQAPEMPRAAIERHAVDDVLELPAMAACLAQLSRAPRAPMP